MRSRILRKVKWVSNVDFSSTSARSCKAKRFQIKPYLQVIHVDIDETFAVSVSIAGPWIFDCDDSKTVHTFVLAHTDLQAAKRCSVSEVRL